MLVGVRKIRLGGATAVVAAILSMLALGGATAGAAPPPLLTQFPEGTGTGANQMRGPRASAVDPDTGHLFVAEAANNRVSEFDAWGVFVKSWGWGVSNGASGPQTCGPAEPEVSPPPGLCQIGLSGSGPGQMQAPNGVAVDSNGNVYVLERLNFRVQKFNAAGQFVLMFGGDVNKTTGGNVCTAASGDTCGSGVKGTGPGEFEPKELFFVGNYLTVAPDDTVYVGDKDRIQHFDMGGTYLGQLPLPKSGYPSGLAFDPVTDALYLSYLGVASDPPVFKLDPDDGKVLSTLESGLGEAEIEALAVGGDGNVYVSINPIGIGTGDAEQPRVVEFSSSGDLLIGPAEEFATPSAAERTAGATELPSVAGNAIGNVYVGRSSVLAAGINAYGPPPTFYGPPPKIAP
ncbi:MAG TPA: NHL repeat-containing protein, partial [Nitrospiraceae bacterium]|nr:NHL repeat-containing protein [Nitrospiraceae bacterium]